MTSPVDQSALSGFAPFAGLDSGQAAAAVRHLQEVVLDPGQVLFRQGDTGDTVFVLVTGVLEVRASGGDGERVLATLVPGTIVGHAALLADEPRSATVAAPDGAVLWGLTADALHAALADGEAWAGPFLLATARQLAQLLGSVGRQLTALVDDADTRGDAAPARVVELDELRRRLFDEWAF